MERPINQGNVTAKKIAMFKGWKWRFHQPARLSRILKTAKTSVGTIKPTGPLTRVANPDNMAREGNKRWRCGHSRDGKGRCFVIIFAPAKTSHHRNDCHGCEGRGQPS